MRSKSESAVRRIAHFLDRSDETFDFIYSIGVLHHTPDTRAAFLRLVPLLKPGGTIAIWVYGKRLRLLVGGEILRAATRWLPRKWLLHASKIAIPLYHIHRLPVVGTATSILLPTSKDPDPEWRWLDTFDWYSPRYQWKHTCEEVEAWFAADPLPATATTSRSVRFATSRTARMRTSCR